MMTETAALQEKPYAGKRWRVQNGRKETVKEEGGDEGSNQTAAVVTEGVRQMEASRQGRSYDTRDRGARCR